MNKTIDKTKAKELINSSKGRIFSASFTKKDFTRRIMLARLGVKKYLKKDAKQRPYDPNKHDLIIVYDMHINKYRTINLKTLDSLNINKTNYIVL